MSHNAHDAYLESRILSADPIELVRLLYQAATGAVRDARRYLAEGDIPARSRAVSKASEVLLELAGALDFQHGGEISQRLAQLYEYMQRRLTEAHFRQQDAPLAEVLGLLATLANAWDGVRAQSQPAEQPVSPWVLPEAAAESASQSWSF
jgi:flagellar protein FliS